MTFPILGGNGAGELGYQIDNSIRLNSSDSAFLKRTNSTAGNRQKWTFSTWVKRTLKVDNSVLIYPHGASNNLVNLAFGSGTIFMDIGGVGRMFQTNAVFRDVSAWYHIVVAFNTTDYSTVSAGQVRVYVNGVEQTFSTTTNMSVGFNSAMNDAVDVGIGRDEGADNNYADHYLAETHLIDGQQLSPTDFGEFDEDSGIWKPIEYTGTYGTNGFYLDFENSGSLGADQSGNGNNFTPTNLASTDQTTDTPTNNFATLNSVERIQTTPSEGNCQFNGAAVSLDSMRGTIGMPTGKWYWEVKVIAIGVGGNIGIATNDSALSAGGTLTGVLQQYSGFKSINGWSNNGSYGGFTTGDIIGVALDMDSGSIEFYKNGSSQGVAYASLDTSLTFFPFVQGSTSLQYGVNFGNPSFSISSGNSDDNGYGNFEYAPPSGYLALCTQNLATELSPTIDDGSAYFHTQLYTGTGSARSVTNDANAGDFQPDWVWFKRRTGDPNILGNGHNTTYDSSRGVQKEMYIDLTSSEVTNAQGLTAFNTDGFSVGTSNRINANNESHVAWQWKANGGTTSSNTDGSITSTVQANPTAGFSIVTYTGTGANATVGHGLGVAPKMIICKQRNNTVAHDWMVYHEGIGNTKYLNLNQTNASGTASTVWQNTTPTSSVFSVGTSGSVNESGKNQLAYCFAEIEGYSKFGSYTGNGSTDGTFIYTGFRPAWVMIKRTDSAGNDWIVIDTKRFTYNQISSYLRANTSDAETDQYNIDEDIVSNGFKLRGDSGNINASGSTYIYMAFAESPFVSSTGIPVTAR